MSWIQAQNPALTGEPYGPLTPPQFWSGKAEYWPGLAVAGMPEPYIKPEVKRKFTPEEADTLRAAMKLKGINQSHIAELLHRATGVISYALRRMVYLTEAEIEEWKEFVGMDE